MTNPNPLVSGYLRQFGRELDRIAMDREDRDEIVREIQSHFTDSTSSRDFLDVVERLGQPDELAHAYAFALRLEPTSRDHSSMTDYAIAGIRKTFALLASSLLVFVMGITSVGVTVTGLGAILIGIFAPFVPSAWFDPTLRPGLPQLIVIIAGVVLTGIGALSIRLAYWNAKLHLRSIRYLFKEKKS